MKKLYTAIAILALASVGAYAQKTSDVKSINTHHATLVEKVRATGIAKAPAKAVAIADIEGEYIWTGKTALNSGSDPVVPISIEVADAATGEVDIYGLVPLQGLSNVAITAKYDAAKGTLTMPLDVKVGADSDGDIDFYIKSFDADANDIKDGIGSASDAVAAVTTDETGSIYITFPATAFFALGDPKAEDLGWYILSYNNVFTHEVELPDERSWSSAGTAKFQDGWALPLFGIEQWESDYIFNVAIEQCNEDPDTYRLVDPYHNEDFALCEDNTCLTPGYIEFNISDPDHVYFNDVKSGFGYAAAGFTDMYCHNFLTYLMYKYNVDAATVVEAYAEEEGMLWATYKNGVLTLPSVFVSATDGYENDACFGINGNTHAGYGWQDNSGVSANMETKIWFTAAGINDIISDNEADAPVEYFNLQGMRIAQPEAGQLVISRQGTKTAKVLVK